MPILALEGARVCCDGCGYTKDVQDYHGAADKALRGWYELSWQPAGCSHGNRQFVLCPGCAISPVRSVTDRFGEGVAADAETAANRRKDDDRA